MNVEEDERQEEEEGRGQRVGTGGLGGEDGELEEAEIEKLQLIKSQLEREILEDSCGALTQAAFTPSISAVIIDEVTLLINMKVILHLYHYYSITLKVRYYNSNKIR